MKFILLFVLLLSVDAIGQGSVDIPDTIICPPRTISTNPDPNIYDNSVDPSDERKWDWTTQNYTVYLTNQLGTPGTPVTIVSPFYDQSQNPNDFFLANQLVKDNNPLDGWELLYRQFGSAGQGVITPYFVLYNRYNGTIRVLANIINSGEFPYTAAGITLSYLAPQGFVHRRQTAVLNQVGKYTFTPNNMQKDAHHFIPNHYTNSGVNNNYFWLVADYYAIFDPCTCGMESEWYLTIGLISNIDVKATVNGTQTTMVDANPNNNNPNETTLGSFFGRVQQFSSFGSDVIEGASGVFASANKGMDDGQALINNAYDFTANSVSVIGYKKAVSLARILGGIIQTAPQVNFMFNLANSLVTTVKKLGNDYNDLKTPKSIDALGKTNITEVRTTMDITGNLSITSNYVKTPLRVPGANTPTGLGGIQSYLPIYDNTLGVINLFEQPEFKITSYPPDNNLSVAWYYQEPLQGSTYQTDNDQAGLFPKINHLEIVKTPKLLVNPASGMKVKSVDYQVVFENDENSAAGLLTGPMVPGEFTYHSNINVPWAPEISKTIFPATSLIREKLYENYGYQLDILNGSSWDGATLSTPYLNQNCFMKTGIFSYSDIVNPRLRMKVVLEPVVNNPNSEVDEVIIVHTYPAKVTQGPGREYYVLGTPQYPYDHKLYKDLVIDLPIDESKYLYNHPSDVTLMNETINSNLTAIGNLTVGPNVSFSAGTYTISTTGNIYFDNSLNSLPANCDITFVAGKEIFVAPSAIVTPEVILTIVPSIIYPCETIPDMVPTDDEIIKVCEGPEYNGRSFPSKKIMVSDVETVDKLPIFRETFFDFTVYPNPASTQATISMNTEGPFDITMTDVRGNVVGSFRHMEGKSLSFDVSTLAQGVYLINLTTDKGTQTKQLIVQ